MDSVHIQASHVLTLFLMLIHNSLNPSERRVVPTDDIEKMLAREGRS